MRDTRIASWRKSRMKNPKYLAWIRTQPCVICENPHTEAAHLRLGDMIVGKRHTGLGEKPDDKWAIPLCSYHHRKQHSGNEGVFWRDHGINPFEVCDSLFNLFLKKG